MTNLARHPTPTPAMPALTKQRAQPVPIDDLRAQHRFSVNQRVSVTLIGTPECRLTALVRNVSRKGLRLELDCCVLNAGAVVKIEWEDRVLLGNVRHLNQRGGSTILGVELSSSWESFLEEILARHGQELEKSHQDLQSLTCLASQEMQETLAVAVLFMDLFAKKSQRMEDTESVRIIACARSAARRVQELTLDLAAYAQAIAEPVEMTPVECERVVRSAALVLAAQENTVVSHDRLPIAMADARGLGLVFKNLISNGLKFNRAQSRRVHISAKYKGTEWFFSVSDNGIGIDLKAQARLFQPLARLHDGPEFPGSGLGLALSRRIVEKHGGRIWCESEPGVGSTFHFTVPARPKPWE